jgi:hypothetical protein
MIRILITAALMGAALVTQAQISGVKKGGLMALAAPTGPRSLLNLYLHDAVMKKGSTDTLHVKVMSVGTEALNVSNIATTSGVRVLNPITTALDPGNHHLLTIVVDAPKTKKTIAEEKLTVVSNSGREEVLVMRLRTE